MDIDTLSPVFYNLRLVVSCLGSLIGIVVGIVLMARKSKKAGLFALIGFSLFGIEPLLNFLLYQVLLKTLIPYQQIFLAYPCISGATFLLGCIALMIALFSGARPSPAPSIRQCQYCGALLAPGVQVCDRCGQPAYR